MTFVPFDRTEETEPLKVTTCRRSTEVTFELIVSAVGSGFRANVAVSVKSPSAYPSVRAAVARPSLHVTKWYPEIGTAVTAVPVAPNEIVWLASPLMVPSVPAR